jgi:hypothetical protein
MTVNSCYIASRRASRSVLLSGALAILAGCVPRVVQLDSHTDGATEEAVVEPGYADWGLTLSRNVSGDKVDFDHLVTGHSALDRFLAGMQRFGPATKPDAFPDRDSRLAYLINCHNACVLRSVVELAGGKNLPALVPGDLESRFRFRIDGGDRTPAELRRSALELAADDWRVRLVLYDARNTGPPLSRRPFTGDLLDAQLNQATREALASPHVIRIDHGEDKRILVWGGLLALHDRLVRDYDRRLQARGATFLDVLLEWADRPQRELLNAAVGYRVAAMPSDDRLGSLTPPAPVAKQGLFEVFRSIQSTTFLRPQP